MMKRFAALLALATMAAVAAGCNTVDRGSART